MVERMQAGMNGNQHLMIGNTVAEEYCTSLLHKVDFVD
jgi:hypothetical protein